MCHLPEQSMCRDVALAHETRRGVGSRRTFPVGHCSQWMREHFRRLPEHFLGRLTNLPAFRIALTCLSNSAEVLESNTQSKCVTGDI